MDNHSKWSKGSPAWRHHIILGVLTIAGVGLLVGCDLNTVNYPGLKPTDAVVKDSRAADGGSKDLAGDGVKPGDGNIPQPDNWGGDTICVPEVVDCEGLCGPVKDPCTGTEYQCGGCGEGLVCDLITHLCITPLATCKDLDADCGTIKNSCGDRLDCGYCPAHQECDPDTNKCIPCDETITCADLGYECGNVWLGCGPSSITVTCPGCTTGLCNPFFNTCEPDCQPGTVEDICGEALLLKGVECGQISNGCGGIVDCGLCPDGEACGVEGVANRCEPISAPQECIAAGRNCGTVTSACGGIIHCGECTGDDVCNENGVCGPPCAPKTCVDDFAPGSCGQQLDDGCGGFLKCECPSGEGCNTSDPGVIGTCVPLSNCATYGANGEEGDACSKSTSPSFPRGDGVNLNCPCTGGRFCVINGADVVGDAIGTCCTDTATCSGTNACTVPNTCNGTAIGCCGSNQYCDSSNDTCVDRNVCSDFTDQLVNSPCSNGASSIFPRGDGVNLTCPCVGADLYCTDGNGTEVSGSQDGTCCLDTSSCDGVTSCTTPNTCTGEAVDCCEVDQYCHPITDTCEDLMVCSDYGANGQEGDPCSNGSSPDFPQGEGLADLRCRCTGGRVCINALGDIVSGAESGICCQNTATCTGTTSCAVENSCTGATINCCASTEYCDTGSDTCVDKNTCVTFSATGEIGDPCSSMASSAFPVGDEIHNLTCNCSTSANRQNNTCVGSSATQAGQCQCVANTCDCSVSGTSGGCGDIMLCPCPGGEQCNTTTKTCFVPQTCGDYGATGAIGAPCSAVPTSAFPVGDGSNLTCNCATDGGRDNNNCIGDSSTTAGTCQCEIDTCRGRVGVFPDLCGGSITCSG